MSGYRIDWLLLEILPIIFFAFGLFIYALKLGKLREWLKKLTPLLLYATVEGAHRFFGFFDTSPFSFFLIMFLLFFWCLILHYKNIGLSLFACGGIANAIVSLINGGRMPMLGITAVYSIYQPMTDKTIFPFLCDWISSPFRHYLLSFGDILLAVGITIFLIQGLAGLWRNLKNKIKI